MITLPKIVLASGSPRRKQILTSVGWEFTSVPPDIDETERDGEPPADYVVRLAREKAEVVAASNPGSVVLGADTTVVADGQILGKPVDMDDAQRMVRMLAGNWHEVLTGVAVVKNGETRAAMQRTRVKFSPMTDDEIEFLATEGDPLDKAGAYAVQKQAALFIEGIEGDHWNIVGLPIRLVYELIQRPADAEARA
jgi:septum formation protein